MSPKTPLATDEERLAALWDQPASPAATADASANRAIHELFGATSQAPCSGIDGSTVEARHQRPYGHCPPGQTFPRRRLHASVIGAGLLVIVLMTAMTMIGSSDDRTVGRAGTHVERRSTTQRDDRSRAEIRNRLEAAARARRQRRRAQQQLRVRTIKRQRERTRHARADRKRPRRRTAHTRGYTRSTPAQRAAPLPAPPPRASPSPGPPQPVAAPPPSSSACEEFPPC